MCAYKKRPFLRSPEESGGGGTVVPIKAIEIHPKAQRLIKSASNTFLKQLEGEGIITAADSIPYFDRVNERLMKTIDKVAKDGFMPKMAKADVTKAFLAQLAKAAEESGSNKAQSIAKGLTRKLGVRAEAAEAQLAAEAAAAEGGVKIGLTTGSMGERILKEQTKTFVEGLAKKNAAKGGRNLTVDEFFTVFRKTVDDTVDRFEAASKKGTAEKMSRAQIEGELLIGAQESVDKAIGEAMAIRMERACNLLVKRMKSAGLGEKELKVVLDRLSEGEGDITKIIKETTAVHVERDIILKRHAGGLTMLDKEMINSASHNGLFNQFQARKTPIVWTDSMIRNVFKGGARLIKIPFPTLKKLMIKTYGVAARVRHPGFGSVTSRIARDEIVEKIGIWMDKHPDATRRMTLNRSRILSGGIILGTAYLTYLGYGLIFGEEEAPVVEAGMKSVRMGKTATAKNAEVAAILFHATKEGIIDDYLKANMIPITNLIDGATTTDAKTKKPRPLTQKEKLRMANILVAYRTSEVVSGEKKRAFELMGGKKKGATNKKQIIKVLAILQQLKNTDEARLGELAVDIAMGVNKGQSAQFALELVTSKKTKQNGIRYLYEHPPKGYTMTMSWLGRPINDIFSRKIKMGRTTHDGFTPNENLVMLRAGIRKRNRIKGKEVVPLTDAEIVDVAEIMAELYIDLSKYRAGRPTVPDEHQVHLDFIMGLKKKGFSVIQAGTVLFALEYAYLEKYRGMEEEIRNRIPDPLQDDTGRKQVAEIVKKLKPGMDVYELRDTVTFEASRQAGMATDMFKRQLNTDLVAALGVDLAFALEANPRYSLGAKSGHPQVRRLGGALLREVVRTWKAYPRRRYAAGEIEEFVPYVVNAAVSSHLTGLKREQKADILDDLFRNTGRDESIRLHVKVPAQHAQFVDPASLPLEINLAAPKAEAGKLKKREKRMSVNLRALALRHTESYVKANPAATVDEIKADSNTYVEFVRGRYHGKRTYTPIRKIEDAFARQNK